MIEHKGYLHPEADWVLLDKADGQQVRLRFHGPFEAREVTWDATFLALGVAPEARNFIEIGEAGPLGIALQVGLRIPYFSQADILKTVMMVRRYKRLRRGRHEYGGP